MIWLDSAILVRRSIRRGKGPGSGMSETNDSSPEGSESSDRRNTPKRSAFQISRTSVAEQANGEYQTTITEIEVPWRTIMRIVMAMALIYFFLQLWTQVVIVFIAIILTLALDPIVHKLERRGLSRGRSVLAVISSLILALAVVVIVVAPPLVDQGANLVDNLPEYADELSQVLDRYPTVDEWINEASEGGGNSNSIFERVMSFVPDLLSFGAGILSGFVSLFFLFVLTIYLLLDGPRLFESYVGRLDPVQRARFKRLRLELAQVVNGYVVGQTIVSSCFGVFTFVVLTVVGTPEALLLAVLAALLDAIPMVGATLATIPAVLMSLTVSVPAALVVLGLFVIYQQVENNFIAPRAFRNTLKISSLAVLLAVSFGSALFGVLGAMLALPVAAAIPALVRGLREGVPMPQPESDSLSWPSEPPH